MIAVALAIALSAFTGKPSGSSKAPDPEYWYEFTGTNQANPLHYTLVGGTGANPPACDAVTGTRCAIKTEMQGQFDPNPGYPFVSTYSQERKKP